MELQKPSPTDFITCDQLLGFSRRPGGMMLGIRLLPRQFDKGLQVIDVGVILPDAQENLLGDPVFP